MSSDIVQKFPTLGECNRYTNGVCSTRSCMIRGGWKQGDAVDYDIATCETRDIRKTIEALEGEVVAATKHAQLLNKMLGEAEARAERLRAVVDRLDLLINKDNDEAKTLIRTTLKDDKQ